MLLNFNHEFSKNTSSVSKTAHKHIACHQDAGWRGHQAPRNLQVRSLSQKADSLSNTVIQLQVCAIRSSCSHLQTVAPSNRWRIADVHHTKSCAQKTTFSRLPANETQTASSKAAQQGGHKHPARRSCQQASAFASALLLLPRQKDVCLLGISLRKADPHTQLSEWHAADLCKDGGHQTTPHWASTHLWLCCHFEPISFLPTWRPPPLAG